MIVSPVLLVAVALGGFGLLTLLPRRGGTTTWVGGAMLACAVAGVVVHLVGRESWFTTWETWGVGLLAVSAFAAATVDVVVDRARLQLAAHVVTVAVTSLLVAIGGGAMLGAACLLVHGSVVARSLSSVGREPDERTPSTRGPGENVLAVLAASAVVAALFVLVDRVLPATEPAAADTTEPVYLHGMLASAGTLLLVGLAVLGTTTSLGSGRDTESVVRPVTEGDP